MSRTERVREVRVLERLAVQSAARSGALLPGRRPGKGPGTSAEFVDYRDYSPGDDMRYVDWNVHARLRRLLTRQYRADAELDVHLLLDVSASMGFGSPAKLDVARQVVAALAFTAINNLDRVGLTTFATRPHRIAALRRGSGQLGRINAALATLAAAGPTDFDGAMHAYALSRRRPGVALIISDFFDESGYQRGVERLLHHRFEVLLIQVLADEELRPRIRSGNRIVDLEEPAGDGRAVDDDLIERYVAAVHAYNRELASFCGRRGLPYACVRNTDSFEALVRLLLDARVWGRR